MIFKKGDLVSIVDIPWMVGLYGVVQSVQRGGDDALGVGYVYFVYLLNRGKPEDHAGIRFPNPCRFYASHLAPFNRGISDLQEG